MRLVDRVALVTGGSGGIGEAICRALAGAGAVVALHYHSHADAADRIATDLRQAGHRAEVFQADVTSAEGARALVAEVIRRMGRLDILVNNAGITIGGQDLVEVSLDDWRRVLEVNLDSVFYMCRAAVPHLRQQGGGGIVNIASNVVNTLPPGSAAYACSKAGVVALTKVLSKEEARHGIRVNAVSPGIIHAGMGVGALERRPPEVRERFLKTIPMQRTGGAEEVAAAVVFLVTDEASYVTGQHLSVNGGDRTESYQ
jgi:3-oxoacyl-[acyl-carrier protein] reductase